MHCRYYIVLVLFSVFLSGSCSENYKIPSLPSLVTVHVLSKYRISDICVISENSEVLIDNKLLMNEQSNFNVTNQNGKMVFLVSDKKISCKKIEITGSAIKVQANSMKLPARIYPDKILIVTDGDELQIINTPTLEKYVHAAALSEGGELYYKIKNPESRKVFLSVMEIVIRSYVVSQPKRHEGAFQFCDLTHCVNYQGLVDDAQSVAPGAVLMNKGHVIEAYFHSTCGGQLSPPSVWWSDESRDNDYKDSKDDLWFSNLCKKSPHYNWESQLERTSFAQLFGLNDIVSVKCNYKYKRVNSVIFSDGKKEVNVDITQLNTITGKAFGWNKIKSNYFTVELTGRMIIFKGHGLGHGIGLCQYGSAAMAEKGYSCEKIIKHYYNGRIVCQ